MVTKSDTFTHKFDGWHEAEARRWTNPDGIEGGIVATSAKVHPSVTLPSGVEVWPNAQVVESASIGVGASIAPRAGIGEGVIYDASDWLFVVGPQGSRGAWATAVWSPKHGLRWWVGCQHGLSTDELLARIEDRHGASDHGDDYRYLVKVVTEHPGLARAMAAKPKGGAS